MNKFLNRSGTVGSKEDFHLSTQAIRLGAELKQGKIGIKEFRINAQRILQGKTVYNSNDDIIRKMFKLPPQWSQ